MTDALAAIRPDVSAGYSLVSGRVASKESVQKAAEDFQSMMFAQMMQPAWESVPTDDTFGGGHAEETFRGFMLQEFGRLAAKQDALHMNAALTQTLLDAQARTQKDRS